MNQLTIITHSYSKTDRDALEIESKLRTTNKPFTRYQSILDTIARSNLQFKFVLSNNDLNDVKQKITPYLHYDYLDFLEHAYESFDTTGKPAEHTSVLDNGLVNYKFGKPLDPINLNNLPYYLRTGFYGSDYCTSIFPHTYETALRSADNCLVAADYVSELDVDLSKNLIVYCPNIFPGHHATNYSYSGYCFLNNIAICAKSLELKKKRVAILDLDFHHGDGTQRIFYMNKNVLTISIHGDPSTNYPFFTGYENETGLGDGENYNLNLPLPVNTNLTDYLVALNQALDKIIAFNPDMLLIAFGADTYKTDVEGHFDLNIDDYQTIGHTIRSRIKLPTIVTQEGGYCMDTVGAIVIKFLNGLCLV